MKIYTGGTMYNADDFITVSELARRLHMNKADAYNLAASPGFPIYNLGGQRRNKIIWGDALDWIRQNCAQKNRDA